MSFADWFFPPKCACCRELLGEEDRRAESRICPKCHDFLERAKADTCEICGRGVTECDCQPKEMERAGCKGLRKLYYYKPDDADDAVKRLIFYCKRHREEKTPTFLAKELLPAISSVMQEAHLAPEDVLVTFLPRRKRAVVEFGVDQAELLAKQIAEVGNLPMERLLERRSWYDKEQKRLSPAKRKKNVQNAFLFCQGFGRENHTAFLVDDIVTTGAGMAACARVLKKNGIRDVYCFSVTSDVTNRRK